MIGALPQNTKPKTRPQSAVYGPIDEYMPTVIVFTLPTNSGVKKSFQIAEATNIITVAVQGFSIGHTILKKV